MQKACASSPNEASSKRKSWLAPTDLAAGSVARCSARRKETIGRALMTDIAVDPERTPEFVEQRYRFDFGCVSHGRQRLQLVVPLHHRRRTSSQCGHLRSAPARIGRRGRRTKADDCGTGRRVSRTSARRLDPARHAMAFVPDSMVRRARQLRSRTRHPWPATLPASIR